MGIIMVGTALGGVVFAPLAHDLIGRFGWRTAYVILGVTIPVVVVPLAIFVVRRSPESIGLRPDGDPSDDAHAGPRTGEDDARDSMGLGAAEAMRTGSFWCLFFVRFFMVMATGTIAAHTVPIVVASGLGALEGPEAAMMIGSRAIRDFLIVSIAGKFLGGWAAERLQKRLVLVVQFAFMILAAGTLFALDNLPALYLFVLLYGIGNGGAVVYPLVVAGNFGVKSFSKIIGIMGIPLTLGAAIGQMGAARIFDATGSYAVVFAGLVLVNGIAGVLVGIARPPRGRSTRARRT
jgi:MFS family permease